jgi:hypothetical protein
MFRKTIVKLAQSATCPAAIANAALKKPGVSLIDAAANVQPQTQTNVKAAGLNAYFISNNRLHAGVTESKEEAVNQNAPTISVRRK